MLFAHFGDCSGREIKPPKNGKVTEHLTPDIWGGVVVVIQVSYSLAQGLFVFFFFLGSESALMGLWP